MGHAYHTTSHAHRQCLSEHLLDHADHFGPDFSQKTWHGQRQGDGVQMKMFVAGATGAMGKRLVPTLVDAGHQVVAMTRSADKTAGLAAAGAQPVVADGLDRTGVMRVVTETAPEVIIHQMTGLAGMKRLKRFDAEFAATNRLRTQGTDNLLAAARAAGVRRIVAQSYGNWNYERTGAALKTEEDPFDPDPPANQRQTLKA